MFLIDSHCHLDMLIDKDGKDISEIIKEAEDLNVKELLCASVTTYDWPRMKSICSKYSNIHLSAGIHPCHAFEDQDFEILEKQIKDDQVIAIGETGLDFFHQEKENDKKLQKISFEKHIDLAKKYQKPLIIHTREAKEDTILILKSCNADKIGGVMHCFTENVEMAKKALDLGFYISLSGIVTFKNATQVQDVARFVPSDRLLIETDAPYLAPTPKRGKVNQPAYTAYVADFIANLRGVSLDEITKITQHNFYKAFKINK